MLLVMRKMEGKNIKLILAEEGYIKLILEDKKAMYEYTKCRYFSWKHKSWIEYTLGD